MDHLREHLLCFKLQERKYKAGRSRNLILEAGDIKGLGTRLTLEYVSLPRVALLLYLVSLVFSCSEQFCHSDGVEAFSVGLSLEFGGSAIFCDRKVAAFLSPNPNMAYQKFTT